MGVQTCILLYSGSMKTYVYVVAAETDARNPTTVLHSHIGWKMAVNYQVMVLMKEGADRSCWSKLWFHRSIHWLNNGNSRVGKS